MPKAIDHPAVREQVRILYVSNGRNLSIAAEACNVPYRRAQKWLQRGNWNEKRDEITRQSDVSHSVSKATNHAESVMQDLGSKSKIALARAGYKAAEHYEKLPGRRIAKDASNYKSIIQGNATLHAWEAKEAGTTFSLNVLNYGTCGIEVRESSQDPESRDSS
jgi:hypothetical protein